MPMVQAKCENCGGILAVDSNLKAANCPFCGAAYVVQDCINYYNSVTKVEHMHADVVNISDESSSEGRLRAAEAYMKMKKYSDAEAEYQRVTKLTPQDYRGWEGLIKSETHEFDKRIKSSKTITLLDDYARSVELFSAPGTSDVLLNNYRDFITAQKDKNMEEKAAISEEIRIQGERYKQLAGKEKETVDLLNQVDSRRNEIFLWRVQQKEKKEKNKKKKGLVVDKGELLAAGIIFFIFFLGFISVSVVLGICNFLASAGCIVGFIVMHKKDKDMNKEEAELENRHATLNKEISVIRSSKDEAAQSISVNKAKLSLYD